VSPATSPRGLQRRDCEGPAKLRVQGRRRLRACCHPSSRSPQRQAYKAQSPCPETGRGFVLYGAPGGDLLSRGQSALSSAQSRFTVLFGMGRRGSNSLWPPSKLSGPVVLRRRLRIRVAGKQQQYWKKYFLGLDSWQHRPLKALSLVWQGYRIKPHGQLVSVSLTHYCASTPDLSTRWSSATL
jgi:hypothetical protein